jgi:GT2 family glycosyltransferase
MKKLKSAVIIPTCNRKEDIKLLLADINNQTIVPEIVLVVDSSDSSLSQDSVFLHYLKSLLSLNVIILFTKKRGAALQRNIGIFYLRASSSIDLVFFLDDDMSIPVDYIEKMQGYFLRDANFVGGMSGLEVERPRFFNNVLRRLFLMQSIGIRGEFKFSGMPEHSYFSECFQRVRVLNGCAAYRMKILREFEFDEYLGKYSYMEDCDFSYRVSRVGNLFFNPNVVMIHRVSSFNRVCTELNRAIYIKNYSYIFFKNFFSENRLRVVAYAWSVIGLFMEAILARNWAYLRGYYKGLKAFIFSQKIEN